MKDWEKGEGEQKREAKLSLGVMEENVHLRDSHVRLIFDFLD